MIAERLNNGEKDGTGDTFHKPATTPLLNAIYNIAILLTQRFKKFAEDFRLLLKITVNKEDKITLSIGQPRHHRFMMAKIPHEVDDYDPRVCAIEIKRQLQRVIRRAIVYKNDLNIIRYLFCSRNNPCTKLLNRAGRSVKR